MPRPPHPAFPDPALIATTAALQGLCERLAAEEFVTVDTEFMRERTYWPELCVVQLAGEHEVAVIDAQRPDIDLAPLGELLANQQVLKVFHAARQDVEIFVLRFGHVPRPLFDTQIAAMVAGFGEQVGYDALVSALAGGSIEKAHRFSDWSARPLSAAQIAYAAADVTYLRTVYARLCARLRQEGRLEWVAEEMAELADPSLYRADPDAMWERLRPRSNNRRYLGMVRALAAWREREAQRVNIPRQRLLRDETLLEIAATAPGSPEALTRARGISRGFAEGRTGASLLAVIAEAKSLPEEALPAAPRGREGARPSPALVALLKVLLAAKCEDHHVAARLVASSEDIDRLAAGDAPDIPAMHGWRRAVFGEDALALKQGRVALGVAGRKVKLIPAGRLHALRAANDVLGSRSVRKSGLTLMSDTRGARGSMSRLVPRLALLIFAFLLIIANGVVALTALDQLRAANRQIKHTLEATQALKRLEDLAEAGGRQERGYRAFGDPRLLDAYRASRTPIEAALQRVRELLTADAQHPEALDRLASLIDQTSSGLAETQPPPAARGVLPPELRASVARTDAVVATINGLLADQRGVLDKRLRVIASRNTVTFITVLLGTGGGIALVGIVFVLMRLDLQSSLRLVETRSGALQQSEQRFRRIFEGSPLGILLGDPDGRISQANPAFCRMLGRTADELVGRNIAELAHLDDREVLADAIRCGTEPDQEIETRYVTRTGGIAWASVHLAQLIASDDRARLLLVLTEDITGQRRAEAELRQAQKMEAIGQLTGGIAHDFNNLLGVIIGNVEFLLESAANPMQADMAKEILDSALSGADLTRRLLAFARRQPLQPRRIDLNAYLPNHIAIVRRLLGEAVSIEIDLSPDLWPTRADPSQVGDALLNLAINARDAMPHGGHILIRTANVHLDDAEASEVKSGDYVVLSMTDTGIGMTPEVRERVMEPFFTTKAPGSGSGLGLSMIFGFAKQSGGHLDIESAPGHGTTVRLYLPRAVGQEISEAAQADWTMPHGHESILLVDDKPEMRAVARRHLASLGYQVSEADCGSVALDMLRASGNFDLLFTDIVMPEGMSGHQLAAAAKHLQPGLKVLFTTGYFHTDPDASPSLDSDTIRKPYRRQELAAAVRAALEA